MIVDDRMLAHLKKAMGDLANKNDTQDGLRRSLFLAIKEYEKKEDKKSMNQSQRRCVNLYLISSL